MKSPVRMIPQKQFTAGKCQVCGAAAIIKWQDPDVGRMGDCCYGAVIMADKALAGFSRPKEGGMRR